MPTSTQEWIEASQNRILEEFYTFLRFPSISSEPEFADSVRACADWLIEYLKKMHFNVELWPTDSHPVIFASQLNAGPYQPTLLIYNHYDVQPVDPIEEWYSPPFQPLEKNGEIYARGAQDNKGQCFTVLQALKFLSERDKELPINIKWCIEGEEEIGSPGLSQLLASKKEALKADYLVIVDVGIPNPHTPAITLGTRGIITLDVELQCSPSDMHSGSHGGLALNPIHALIKLLSNLRDETGKITIPGFYDEVETLSSVEKAQFATDFNEEEYRNKMGCEPVGGELHFPPLERKWFRPTLEINGIWGGYTGKGFKTVIPAKAYAKISCRLVPHQDPVRIGNLVAENLRGGAPKGATVTVQVHLGYGEAMRVNPNSKVVKAFAKAYEEIFKSPCKKILSGASIPIVPELTRAAGAETVLMGLGLPTDNIHAPNEHYGVDRIRKGIEIIVKAIENLSKEMGES